MAKINIYCDESCHLEHDGIKPMLLGCVWCEEQKKDAINYSTYIDAVYSVFEKDFIRRKAYFGS